MSEPCHLMALLGARMVHVGVSSGAQVRVPRAVSNKHCSSSLQPPTDDSGGGFEISCQQKAGLGLAAGCAEFWQACSGGLRRRPIGCADTAVGRVGCTECKEREEKPSLMRAHIYQVNHTRQFHSSRFAVRRLKYCEPGDAH